MRILVADDDPHISKLISVYLRKEGFEVFSASDGDEALELLEAEPIQLAVIDVMMPKMDGYELCREIRSYYEIPVLMVTAKGEPEDKMKGFQLGTDDYVVKPFDPMELVMRVKALLRRYKINSSSKLSVGDLNMDSSTNEAEANGQGLHLPRKEFRILFQLASYPKKIFTRNQLIEEFWGVDYDGDERTIDVHIKRIRERLKSADSSVKISTVRGIGYRLEEDI